MTDPTGKYEARIVPPALTPEIFDLTMKGLEAGLRVGDITTYDLVTCDAADDAEEVLRRADLHLFDCVPVRDQGRVVGVLERNGPVQTGLARDRMRRLDDGLLVSADEPLKAFIPLLVETPHRLVVRGSRIEGIVTRSDVHKLPVRLLAFALITHLEMTMSVVISGMRDEDWLQLLPQQRRAKVLQKFDALRTENFDPPLIEVTDFCDKRDALSKLGILNEPSKKGAVRVFRQIEELRNKVAHAATYAESDAQFVSFVELLQLAEQWIGRLSTLIVSDSLA